MILPRTVHIDAEALTLFPDLTVHSLVCRLPAEPAPLADSVSIIDALEGLDLETLSQHPVVAPWRAAMKAMGLKPADHRGSLEQLLRRALRGAPAGTGLGWVDLYNGLSIAHGAPMGGYDMDALEGEVRLRPARPPSDRFEPIGGQAERFPVQSQVLVYAADDTVLCWALNVRDSVRTCLKPSSRNALFVSEAVNSAGARASKAALDHLARLVLQAGGAVGQVKSGVVERAWA